MFTAIRHLITRIFGSDEVEQHYSVDSVSAGKVNWEHYHPRDESPTAPVETPVREQRQPRRKPALQGN